MEANELKKRIFDEAATHGITLTEDELNAKVLEASRMDPGKLDRLNGGGRFVNCDTDLLCWSDYVCVTWNKEQKFD